MDRNPANSCSASWVTFAESDQTFEMESNEMLFLAKLDEQKPIKLFVKIEVAPGRMQPTNYFKLLWRFVGHFCRK